VEFFHGSNPLVIAQRSATEALKRVG